jgi:hypothetical protein
MRRAIAMPMSNKEAAQYQTWASMVAVVTSSRDLKCTYNNRGMSDEYVGHITKLGVDIGYHGAGKLAWAVIAPTPDVPKGSLTGTYSGISRGAAVGIGAGANVLVGAGRTISLQPVSVEGMTVECGSRSGANQIDGSTTRTRTEWRDAGRCAVETGGDAKQSAARSE